MLLLVTWTLKSKFVMNNKSCSKRNWKICLYIESGVQSENNGKNVFVVIDFHCETNRKIYWQRVHIGTGFESARLTNTDNLWCINFCYLANLISDNDNRIGIVKCRMKRLADSFPDNPPNNVYSSGILKRSLFNLFFPCSKRTDKEHQIKIKKEQNYHVLIQCFEHEQLNE